MWPSSFAIDGKEPVDTCLDSLFSLDELGRIDVGLGLRELLGKVVADGDGDDEIAVGKALHKG